MQKSDLSYLSPFSRKNRLFQNQCFLTSWLADCSFWGWNSNSDDLSFLIDFAEKGLNFWIFSFSWLELLFIWSTTDFDSWNFETAVFRRFLTIFFGVTHPSDILQIKLLDKTSYNFLDFFFRIFFSGMWRVLCSGKELFKVGAFGWKVFKLFERYFVRWIKIKFFQDFCSRLFSIWLTFGGRRSFEALFSRMVINSSNLTTASWFRFFSRFWCKNQIWAIYHRFREKWKILTQSLEHHR